MTEAEWPDCTDYKLMATFLRGRISPRKDRLFNVACCRRLWHLFGRPAVREAILVAERYAEGQADAEELRAALRTIQSARAAQPTASPYGEAHHAAAFAAITSPLFTPLSAAGDTIRALGRPADGEEPGAAERREHAATAALIREIVGDPFRPARLDRSWLSPSVEAMAQGIYADHDFAAMPILADALQDAGCDDADLLGHCRGGGPHFRGCWALDLILGKK